MDVHFFIKGLIIGFTIAASIGPIGILCIRRSLANDYVSGLASGMGVATADGCYGAVAAFGLTFISSFLIKQHMWLQIIGIIFLVYLGVKMFIEKPKDINKGKIESRGLVGDYVSMFFLTIFNPMTILLFSGVFAGLGVAQGSGNYASASMLTLGVFTGSGLLYFLLSIVFGVFGKKLKSNVITVVNRISGSIIIGFALVTVISLIKG
ncbi:LysE family transporter [Candidatus Gracilibacteria bacterium]|nr:LysE family transporter [Candidatus Gracilibacteria bacterium]